MTKTKTIIIFLIFFFGVLGFGKSSWAAVNLPWSTTYDCADWNSITEPLNCDGLSPAGGWTCGTGGANLYEQITSDANFPGGGGGKGQRHWLGDGLNVNSGGTVISFNAGQPEIWIRWYMRFEAGFQWSQYAGYKIIYLYDQNGNNLNYFMVGLWGDDNFAYTTQMGDGENHRNYESGWSNVFCGGGSASNGSWHSIELHIKSETAAGNDGIAEWWIDGVLRRPNSAKPYNTINHGLVSAGRTIGGFMIGSNAKYPSNGRCMAVDFDDIAISNTGYIGPITPSDTTPPAPPSGVTIL